jgi:small nuclear ribonucleoprotein (snRNP)-like protein
MNLVLDDVKETMRGEFQVSYLNAPMSLLVY